MSGLRERLIALATEHYDWPLLQRIALEAGRLALDEAATLCATPEPQCCGSFQQASFDEPPECCGNWEPRPKEAKECEQAILELASALNPPPADK